jgi:hypothetical protein
LSYVAHLVPDEKDATNMSACLSMLSQFCKKKLGDLWDGWRGDEILGNHHQQSYSMVSLTDDSNMGGEENEEIFLQNQTSK